jgi:hypothetical protein
MADFVAPKNAPERAEPVGTHGDRAGEYLQMPRGGYSAWLYVGFAFFYQVCLVGGIICGVGYLISHEIMGSRTEPAVFFGAGVLAGVPVAYFAFRDRWKCIEAFSSRWCSGVMNLSLVYVPVVALVYANVRALQKLKGR